MTKIKTSLLRGMTALALAVTVLAGLTTVAMTTQASARPSQLQENSSHWHSFCVEHPRACWPRG